MKKKNQKFSSTLFCCFHCKNLAWMYLILVADRSIMCFFFVCVYMKSSIMAYCWWSMLFWSTASVSTAIWSIAYAIHLGLICWILDWNRTIWQYVPIRCLVRYHRFQPQIVSRHFYDGRESGRVQWQCSYAIERKK